jgi:hypothetical protein
VITSTFGGQKLVRCGRSRASKENGTVSFFFFLLYLSSFSNGWREPTVTLAILPSRLPCFFLLFLIFFVFLFIRYSKSRINFTLLAVIKSRALVYEDQLQAKRRLKRAIESKLDVLDPEWRSKCNFSQWEEEFHFTISEVK